MQLEIRVELFRAFIPGVGIHNDTRYEAFVIDDLPEKIGVRLLKLLMTAPNCSCSSRPLIIS